MYPISIQSVLTPAFPHKISFSAIPLIPVEMPKFFTANEPEKRRCDKGMDRPAAVLIVWPQVDAEIPVLPGRRLKYVAPRLSSSARSRPNLSVQAPHQIGRASCRERVCQYV